MFTQCSFDLVRVEADQDGAVHIRHSELVTRIIGLDQLHQLGVQMIPVGQLAAVQWLKNPGFDLLGQKHIRRNHHVVPRITGQQLGLQRFIGVENVVDQLHLGVFFKVDQGFRSDVIEPIVDPQGTLLGLYGAAQQSAGAQGRSQESRESAHCFHSSVARWKPSSTLTALMPISSTA